MSSDAVTRVSVEISGSEISFETGRMAKQASGAVVVRQGDTMVLATAVAGGVRDTDFMPLTVDVEERMYAAGKIPGSFFKREGRPGEKGTLTARMIDRPIRPLFPKEWRYDTQLVAIPMSIDHVHPYDILAMNGASAALMISDIPLPTPVGAVRIGKVGGDFVVNPDETSLSAVSAALLDQIRGSHGADLDAATQVEDKLERQDATKAVEEAVLAQYAAEPGPGAGDDELLAARERRAAAQLAFDKLEKSIIRERIAVHKKRPDGRSEDEIRDISIEVGVTPR